MYRTIAKIALALALSLLCPLAADAKPRKRTEPTAKVDAPGVARAKAELARAKHAVRIAKAAARAAAAIEACHEAVILACEDTTERSVDAGECDAAALKTELAQCSAGSH